jgi:hypothetical protein
VLVSGSCKRESGFEHAKLLRTTLEGCHKTTLRTICISSDGESRPGEALVIETFKHPLTPHSPIYPFLHVLPLMNLEVGEDDLTADKDYKHIFKRLRNLFLRLRGFMVHGIHITQAVVRSHLRSNDVDPIRVDNLFKPEDKQDVKLTYDLLREIWSLPPASAPSRPGFSDTRDAFRTLGALCRHLLLPFICMDLSLSEQLTHLSAAAHMLLAMLWEDNAGSMLMPTQLYIDIMIMIKNVYFCVVKCKVDNPSGQFWIILLGTDCLEELFGILWTMVSNDANLDMLQLVLRLTGTTEVSTILAKYPQWDRAPRRLKLPVLSKDGLDVHKGVDHIKPASWCGNVEVSLANLQTCWKLGPQMVNVKYLVLVRSLGNWTLRVLRNPKSISFVPLEKISYMLNMMQMITMIPQKISRRLLVATQILHRSQILRMLLLRRNPVASTTHVSILMGSRYTKRATSISCSKTSRIQVQEIGSNELQMFHDMPSSETTIPILSIMIPHQALQASAWIPQLPHWLVVKITSLCALEKSTTSPLT